MGNKAKILGLITALIVITSAILKINHIPGANICLMLSLGILFPIYFIINIVNVCKNSNLKIPIAILSYFFLIFAIGFIFLIMHLPGGVLIFKLGFSLTVIMLIILFILNFKSGKIPSLVIALFIILMGMTYFSSFRSVSRDIINCFERTNENYTSTKTILSRQNDSLVAHFDSTAINLIEIHKATNDLIASVEDIKQELAKKASNNQIITDYSSVIHKENYDITNDVMLNQRQAFRLKESLNNYCKKLISTNADENTIEQIRMLLDTKDNRTENGEIENWETSQFNYTPVISAISTLTYIQVNVLISESLVLKNK